MTRRNVVLSTFFIVVAAARFTGAQSVVEKEKLDVEKARVYEATVQPHRPVLAPRGHDRPGGRRSEALHGRVRQRSSASPADSLRSSRQGRAARAHLESRRAVP